MVTVVEVRALARTLPRTKEALVRDRVKFRVGSIVYLAFSRDETVMGFAFPKLEREALVASEPDKFMMPVESDLRYNWVRVRLGAIDAVEMREIVLDAWRMVVPKRVFAEYEAAAPQPLPDIVGPNLRILFVGINPSVYSAAVGHNFARPGNRFWRVLHLAGVTPTLLHPDQDRSLLSDGIGFTNIVDRPSGMAHELSLDELRAGARSLTQKIEKLEPELAVFFGLGAYRKAFKKPKAQIGLQPNTIGTTRLCVLPNPSGAQARYQPPEIAAMLRRALRS
jgi:double-stranded uracil-DNA glycosylase